MVEIFTFSDLSAYVDGEMSDGKRKALAHFIAEDADAASTVHGYREQMVKIKNIYKSDKLPH